VPYLHLDRLRLAYGTQQVLDDLELGLDEGEILALLGPSGSGKTTALRLVAGFATPDAGRVRVDGEDVTALPPARRRFGMVFQHYALFPHLDVGENVAFGLTGLPRAAQEARVEEVLALVGLGGFGRRRVDELSGGQQQRVAIARALAPRPRVLLLDEPMSNLDPTLRERTRRELHTTLKEIGITTLLVTHEQEEAFALGDRVAVLAGGRLEQVAPPRTLYAAPRTAFVATFVGRASVLPATATTAVGGEETTVRLGHEQPGPRWPARPAPDFATAPGPVALVARPESLQIAPDGADTLPATVLEARFLGPATLVTTEVVLDGRRYLVEVLADAMTAPSRGSRVALAPAGGSLPRWLFPVSALASAGSEPEA
jgi:ABC-type Fe3+/spermidine/putrescine transport system ATPase subunit